MAKDFKQRKVLEAASKMFLRHGFGGTQLDAVAREAGVAKQTIYNNFASKAELFDSAILFMLSKIESRINPQWSKLEPKEFLTQLGLEQAKKLTTKDVILFYSLAVREFRSFPSVSDLYAQHVIEPYVLLMANYLTERGTELEDALVLSWCFRAAVTGFSTLINLKRTSLTNGLGLHAYTQITSDMFAKISDKNIVRAPSTNWRSTTESIQSHLDPVLNKTNLIAEGRIDTRTAIMHAAVKVFFDLGFSEGSLDEVAKQASLAKQTIYAHFKSKKLLFEGLCEEILNTLRTVETEYISFMETRGQPPKRAALLAYISSKQQLRRALVVILSESYLFPKEAEAALSFVYSIYPGEQIESESPDSNEVGRVITATTISGSYLLLRELFKTGSQPALDWEQIFSLTEQLEES